MWSSSGELLALASLQVATAIRLHLAQVLRFFGSTTSLGVQRGHTSRNGMPERLQKPA